MNRITRGKGLIGSLHVEDEITVKDMSVVTAVFTVAAAVGDSITTSIQFKDGNGANLAQAKAFPFYLADNASGLTPSTVAPATSLAAGTNGKIIEWVANLSGLVICKADGTLDIVIVETADKDYYIVVVLPSGELAVSGVLAFPGP